MIRQRGLPPRERFDVDGKPYVPRDQLGRVDAMVVAAGEPIARVWSDDAGDLDSLTRRRDHVSCFMVAARLAARATRTGDELDPGRREREAC